MDLQTIIDKMRCESYGSGSEGVIAFKSDVNLIFSNCEAFYESVSDIMISCRILKGFFRSQMP
jgi:hypothetical protein